MSNSALTKISLLSLSVLLLPACQLPFFKKSGEPKPTPATVAHGVPAGDTSKVLVSINGTPRITEEGLNRKLKQMLQADAMTAAIDPATIPVVAKQKFLGDWLNIMLIREVWDGKTQVSQTADFKAALAERMEALEDALIVEKFVDSLKTELAISDDAIRKEFDAHRERYAKVAGGVRLSGAKFSSNDAAKAFETSVAGVKTVADFEKAARANSKAQYRDFGRVSEGAPRSAPQELATEASKMKGLPAVKVVSAADGKWVIFALDKKDAEYYTFDEVKPQIKSMLEGQQFNELLSNKIDGFKKVATVEIDKDYQLPAGNAAAAAAAAEAELPVEMPQ